MSETTTTTETLRVIGDAGALYAALAKAQGEWPEIPRTKRVSVRTKSGGTYTYDYSPLDNTLSVVRPALAANGLAVMLVPRSVNGRYCVTGILAGHGARVEADFRVPDTAGDIKELGGALTYIQRYVLEGLLGVKAETDDDGNMAAGDAREVMDRRPRQERAPAAPADAPEDPGPTEEQVAELTELARRLALTKLERVALMKRVIGVSELRTSEHAERLLAELRRVAGERSDG